MPKKKKEDAADAILNDAQLDETQDDLTLPAADDAVEPIPDDLEGEEDWQEEEDVTTNPSYLDDISDDSVRLYLREIGKSHCSTQRKNWRLPTKLKKAIKTPKTKWQRPTCVLWCLLPSVTAAVA